MSKKPLYKPTAPKPEKLIAQKEQNTGIRIGITYLDTDKYGIKQLFDASRSNKQYLDDLNGFINKARELNDIGKVIQTFISHKKGKNADKISKAKVDALNRDYNLEVDNLIHLHCKIGGNGEFVIHGFQVGNIFEIVWLDPEHKIHKSK